jgi:energy-coupling factor transport system permease protein
VALPVAVSTVPAAIVLAALAAAALLAERPATIAAVAALLLALCLRAPRRRGGVYLAGALLSAAGLVLVTPFVSTTGSDVLWRGPIVPVLGELDVTTEELSHAAVQATRVLAVTLAFAAYALLLDHDRLLQAAGFARRSALAVALATRLLPTLERDASGFLLALRGRGIGVGGVRGRARLVGPLLSASLERGLNLAEAMEARGYGRDGRTRMPARPWRPLDYAAVAAALALTAGSSLWL